jgi:ferric-dicitrate binding protein FerR (iron transport regulator)
MRSFLGGFALVSLLGATVAAAAVVAERRGDATASDLFGEPALLPWTAAVTAGPVRARAVLGTEEEWRRVRRGETLEPLTVVRTGARGRATLERRDDRLRLDPRSQVELPFPEVLRPEAPLTQTQGSVVYEAARRPGPWFRVVTPYLVAVAENAEFLVTVGEHAASVTVERGTIELSDRFSADRIELSAGETVLVDASRDSVTQVLRRAETLHCAADPECSAGERQACRAGQEEFRRLERARVEP